MRSRARLVTGGAALLAAAILAVLLWWPPSTEARLEADLREVAGVTDVDLRMLRGSYTVMWGGQGLDNNGARVVLQDDAERSHFDSVARALAQVELDDGPHTVVVEDATRAVSMVTGPHATARRGNTLALNLAFSESIADATTVEIVRVGAGDGDYHVALMTERVADFPALWTGLTRALAADGEQVGMMSLRTPDRRHVAVEVAEERRLVSAITGDGDLSAEVAAQARAVVLLDVLESMAIDGMVDIRLAQDPLPTMEDLPELASGEYLVAFGTDELLYELPGLPPYDPIPEDEALDDPA